MSRWPVRPPRSYSLISPPRTLRRRIPAAVRLVTSAGAVSPQSGGRGFLGPVRAMLVVMDGAVIQDGTQVPRPDNEHPVRHLGPDGADPALSRSIRRRTPRRSLPASCAGTCRPSGAPKMGGCSGVLAAARSAKASTAGSGTRPAPQPCPKTGQAPSRPAAPTTFAMPRCRCDWPPAPHPPRSLPAPGTACGSCSPSTPTAYPAATRSPASRSSKPSAPAPGPPLAHKAAQTPGIPAVMRPCHSWTQRDTAGPETSAQSGYMFLSCGNADLRGLARASRPRTGDPGHPFT
jgi:hypothetical protein